MEESCFCCTDKYVYPTLWTRISWCICTSTKEELIKLKCCGNYVHRSCFINSSIIRRNNILNSKDIPDITRFDQIDVCHYCKLPNDMIFPYMPNEAINIENLNSILEILLEIYWPIVILLSIGNAISDNVLLGTQTNKGIKLYKNISIDNCELNYTGIYNTSTNIHNYCSDSFEDEWITPVVCIMSILGTVIIYLCIRSAFEDDFMEKYIMESFRHYRFTYYVGITTIYRNESIQKYKNTVARSKQIYKSNLIRLITPSIILIWQLVYLFIILGYNLWYIPSHTSSDTTVEEARKLFLNYIPILCFFNVLWAGVICPMIALILFGIGYCIKKCTEYCAKCIEEREVIKHNISMGENNIKSFSIDIDNSLKKSSVV